MKKTVFYSFFGVPKSNFYRFTILAALLFLAGTLSLDASPQKDTQGEGDKKTIVKIGVVGPELSPIWQVAIDNLKNTDPNIEVQLVEFSDYTMPNRALNDGDIDLNSFQHNAFLEAENSNKGYGIVSIGNTMMGVLGAYSNKITSLDQLKNGDTVIIPNDATNGGRALRVLEAAGVFKVDPLKGHLPAVSDITDNPKNIKIVELDAALLYPSLSDPDVAAGIINSGFIINSGGNPARDAIYIKAVDFEADKPYINIIAARGKDNDNPVYKKVVQAFQQPNVAEAITIYLKGNSFPAW
jgi:D-methionine transport system substrate-binding protein